MPMSEEFAPVAAHYDAAAETYHEQYRRESLLDAKDYPANYVRLQILSSRLAALGAKHVFDIGAGEATPLVVFAKMGMEVTGCDISNGMIEKARKNLGDAGLDPDAIGWGDAEDSVTLAPYVARGPFDAVVAAGVLPHIRNERLFLDNVAMLLEPGGTCFIEFRNKLFSLFTMNRYTKQFILNDLLGDCGAAVRAAVERELDQRLATDMPPRREHLGSGAPGYDLILSKFHNPFEPRTAFRAGRLCQLSPPLVPLSCGTTDA